MTTKQLFKSVLIFSFALSGFAQKESVNSGINTSYLKKDLVVEEWVERLQAEGREVFDNREAIVKRLNLKPGMDIVDIGAGTGAHLPYFSKAVGKNGKVFAVDIVQKFLDHINEQAEQNNWKNVESVLCGERSIKLPKNSVDVAFICNVYHHFEYPLDSITSTHKALRKGGRLVLIDFKRIPGESSEWILGHMRAGQEVFEEEIISAGFKKSEEVTDFLEDNYMVIFEKID
ncbi:methyltransferase domain-containing protein [Opitutia bacterium ISCC 51]|nr:methyltransferase domain-containing protein [Opitutae bacterium ISCC 51]QXD29907.1 methyltransferase domain-containing protein [Opitutae bacterium ISCC 52]